MKPDKMHTARAEVADRHPWTDEPFTTIVKAQPHLTDSQVARIHQLAAASGLNFPSFLNTAFESGLAHADEIIQARQRGQQSDWQPRPSADLDDGIPF